jgi:hypothetical protein
MEPGYNMKSESVLPTKYTALLSSGTTMANVCTEHDSLRSDLGE